MSAGVVTVPGRCEYRLATAHGPLRGTLILPADLLALAILAHAGPVRAANDDALAAVLQHAHIGTLNIDLLAASERRYSDVLHNVSLLAQRLLDALTMLKQQMLLGDLPERPLAFCAIGDCSPAAVRVAALRDHGIFALVCYGGLIDLAGMLYLRSLASPLLLLLDADDQRGLHSNRRAVQELHCPYRCQVVTSAGRPEEAAAFSSLARETSEWLLAHLPAAS